jgi:peptidyl-prolyl cis-trans isomerase D
MLQSIRNNAKGWLAWVIVILISIPFALWGINEYLHPNPKRIVAKVNDVELLDQELQQEVYQRRQQLRAMFQGQPNIDLSFTHEPAFKERVLTDMIERELLIQTAIDAGMRISDTFLAGYIHKIPAFQQEGQFSQTLYEETLANQMLPKTSFEQDIRRSLLIDQLREGILRSALLTDNEQKQRHRLEEQQRYISYLIIPSQRFKDTVNVTEAEIEEYYQNQRSQYKTPEKVSIEYVELSQKNLITQQAIDESTLKSRYQERKAFFTTPEQWKARHILFKLAADATPEQEQTVKETAQNVLTQLREGSSFAELAKQYSDDAGSKKKGGELDWFSPGNMVKPFEDALKTLQINELTQEPVKTQFGFHLIQLQDHRPKTERPFEEVRTQLEQEIKTERAESEFNGQVDQFANLAFEHADSLNVVANTLNLTVKTTGLFDRDLTNVSTTDTNSILSHPEIIKAAFSEPVLKERFNSKLIEIADQHVVVLRIKEHIESQFKPLAEVKDEIVTTLREQKMQAAAKDLGEQLLKQIQSTSEPKTVVTEHNLTWSPGHWIERHDSKLKQPEIVETAFKMGRPKDETAIYHGLQLNDGNYALIAIIDVKDGVGTVAANDQQQLKERQQRDIGETEFNQFLAGLKETADIKNMLEEKSL